MNVLLLDYQEIFLHGLARCLESCPDITTTQRLYVPDAPVSQLCSGFEVVVIGVGERGIVSPAAAGLSEEMLSRTVAIVDDAWSTRAAEVLHSNYCSTIARSAPSHVLQTAVYAASIGRPFVGERVRLWLSTLPSPHMPGMDLTAREKEIMLLLLADRTSAEIARELQISLNTVKYHLHNVYAKLGVSSRRDVRRLAV